MSELGLVGVEDSGSKNNALAKIPDANLEKIIAEMSVPPKNIYGKYKTKFFANAPITFILEIMGYNYREHTVKETTNISNSVDIVGLLEPITLAYDTKKEKWDFVDGEGRTWACYLKGAELVPVEIWFDVPLTGD